MSSQTSLIDTGAEIEFELIKSWKSFAPHFEQARRVRSITFCDSPSLLVECFDEFELEQLEVIVGDIKDYRERLREEDLELVDRLERLKRDEKLLIYTCPSKTVHSKMYVIENENGSVELMTGSANFTRSAWRNQANHMAIIRRKQPGGELYERFMEHYDQQKQAYAKLFLEDLTEEIEDAEDEDREEVIRYWLEGRETNRDEFQELNIKATEQLRTSDGEQEIVLSLNGFSQDTREKVRENFVHYGGTVGSDVARITPPNYSRFLNKLYGIPSMWIDEHGLHFIPPGDHRRSLSERLPDDGAEQLNRALENLEAYFGSVEQFGETNHPRAVKMHMFEALLYVFWAPFVNRQADLYRAHDIENLDKNLPYLYIYGESNSGKGTFAKFALGLISDNRVTGAVDADEVGRKNLRAVRQADSCFPLIVDDIEKGKVNSLEPLKNYWLSWDGTSQFPTAVFISNDRKPNDWFRNRAKILHFDVMFRSTKKGEAEVNRIIKQDNPIYHWISQKLFDRFQRGNVELTNDLLKPVREVVRELYETADRELPDYFPARPAEEEFDIGRVKWQRMRENLYYDVSRKDGTLRLGFGDRLDTWEIDEFRRHLPNDVRATREGRDLVIKNPAVFDEWLGGDPSASGLSAFFRKLIPGTGK